MQNYRLKFRGDYPRFSIPTEIATPSARKDSSGWPRLLRGVYPVSGPSVTALPQDDRKRRARKDSGVFGEAKACLREHLR